MRKIVIFTSVLLLLLTTSSLTQASYDLYLGEAELDRSGENLLVSLALSSDQSIVEAKLEYWWEDDEVHTYQVDSESLGDLVVDVELSLSQEQVPFDQLVSLKCTTVNQAGEVFQWNHHTVPGFEWIDQSWQVLESEHIKLTYKVIKPQVAEQVYLMTNRDLYGLKASLTHEMTHAFEFKLFFPRELWNSKSVKGVRALNEFLSVYTSLLVNYGEEKIAQVREESSPGEIIQGLKKTYWRYNNWGAVTFVDFLKEQYQGQELVDAIRAYLETDGFKEYLISPDYLAYIKVKYGVELTVEEVGSDELHETYVHYYDYAVRPDGSQLVFAEQVDLFHSGLMLLNIREGHVQPITQGDSFQGTPQFISEEEILFVGDQTVTTSSLLRMSLVDREPEVVSEITKRIRILDTQGDQVLCLDYDANVFLLNMNSNERRELFNFDPTGDRWFPTLTEEGVRYYVGNPLENLEKKVLNID